MKKCNKCNEIKPLFFFHRRKETKDGYRGICAECANKSVPTTSFVCEGCKQTILISRKNLNRKTTKFCGKCWNKENSRRNKLSIGDKNPAWKGGKSYHTKGYVYIRDLSEKCGYKFEHRLVMEKHLGRLLEKYEVIHHIDENKTNNTLSNLFVTTEKEHREAHRTLGEVGGVEAYKSGKVIFDFESGLYKAVNDLSRDA